MIYRTDRSEELGSFSWERWLEWEARIIKGQAQRSDALLACLDGVLQSAAKAQKEDQFSDLTYVYVSFLYSHFMRQGVCFSVDAYDAEWLLNPCPFSVLWKPDTEEFSFSAAIQAEADRFPVKDIDQGWINRMLVSYAHRVQMAYRPIALSAFRAAERLPSYSSVAASSRVVWGLGEYMDRMEILHISQGGPRHERLV